MSFQFPTPQEQASSSSTNIQTLAELASSSEVSVRQAVAANSSTPIEVLLSLAAEFPEEVLDNLAFYFYSLNEEDSNWMKDVYDAGIQALLTHEKTQVRLLNRTINISDYMSYKVLMMVLMNPKLSKEVLNKIIQDKSFDVKERYRSAQRNEFLQQDSSSYSPGAIFSHNLEVWEAAQLHVNWNQNDATDINKIVESSMLKTTLTSQWELYLWQIGVIPEYILPILEPKVLEQIFKNPYSYTLAGVVEQITKAPHTYAPAKVLLDNPNIPLNLLEKLLGDDENYIRDLAIYHPKVSFLTLQKLRSQQKAITDLDNSLDSLEELANSEWLFIRKRLASHDKTPVQILAKLAADSDYRVRKIVAINSNTAHPTLEKLAEDTIQQVRECVAKNKKTPTYILEKLSEDNNCLVRKASVENPNISVNHLNKLIANTQDSYVSEGIALNPKTSGIILALLATNKSRKVREAVACHEKTPKIILELLARDVEKGVRLAVAQHPMISKVTLEELTKDKDTLVRETANQVLHPNFIPNVVRVILTDGSGYASSYTNLSPNTPQKILERLLEPPYGESIRASVARHLYTSTNILNRLARDDTYWVRSAVAENINTPKQILEQLAQDSHEDVRKAVARNPHTDTNILEYLARDNDPGVRGTVADNNKTPFKIIEVFLKEDLNNHFCTYVGEIAILNLVHNFTQEPNLPSDILARLAYNEDWRLGVAIARHPNTPDRALKHLSKHSQWQVRMAVANNLNTSQEILEELAQDQNYFVAEDAIISLSWVAEDRHTVWEFTKASNSDTDAELLTEIAQSPLIVIRTLIARHSNTPGEVLKILVTDICEDVRLAVAQNPYAPIHLLKLIAENKSYETQQVKVAAIKNLLQQRAEGSSVYLEPFANTTYPTSCRLFALFHPMAPKEALTKHYGSWYWLERYAIAQNPSTTDEILQILTQDANRIVRTAAHANLIKK